MTRKEAGGILEELKKAVAVVGKKHGIVFDIYSLSYGPEKVTARIKGEVVGKSGSKADAEKQAFDRDCRKVGVKASMYGKKITVNGHSCKIVRVATKAKKYPLIVRDIDGNLFKVTVQHAVMSLVSPPKTA